MRKGLVLTCLLLVAAPAFAATGRMFTVVEVKRFVRVEAGVQLTRVTSASTADVTTLSPGATPPKRVSTRFGRFELYVLRAATQRRTRRALLGNVRPDRRGIYWAPDQQGGSVAYTAYGGNVLVGWFPRGGLHRIDARWTRLHALMRRLR
jgi:hypothetical protein